MFFQNKSQLFPAHKDFLCSFTQATLGQGGSSGEITTSLEGAATAQYPRVSPPGTQRSCIPTDPTSGLCFPSGSGPYCHRVHQTPRSLGSRLTTEESTGLRGKNSKYTSKTAQQQPSFLTGEIKSATRTTNSSGCKHCHPIR